MVSATLTSMITKTLCKSKSPFNIFPWSGRHGIDTAGAEENMAMALVTSQQMIEIITQGAVIMIIVGGRYKGGGEGKTIMMKSCDG